MAAGCVHAMQRGANGFSGYSRALKAFTRLVSSDASGEASVACSLSSTSGDLPPVPFPLARFDEARPAQRWEKTALGMIWGVSSGTWAGTGLGRSVTAEPVRLGGCIATGTRNPADRVDMVMDEAIEMITNTGSGAHEGLLCDSVRRKRKKKMNKHKHSKRLKMNKHKR